MKTTSKFFLGLLCGLSISLFTVITGFNFKSDHNATALKPNASSAEVYGQWVSKQQMESKVQAFETKILSKLENGCKGGFISRSLLKDIKSRSNVTYIKYTFFAEEDGQFGVMFESEKTDEQVLRASKAAFCPTMCDYPSN